MAGRRLAGVLVLFLLKIKPKQWKIVSQPLVLLPVTHSTVTQGKPHNHNIMPMALPLEHTVQIGDNVKETPIMMSLDNLDGIGSVVIGAAHILPLQFLLQYMVEQTVGTTTRVIFSKRPVELLILVHHK